MGCGTSVPIYPEDPNSKAHSAFASSAGESSAESSARARTLFFRWAIGDVFRTFDRTYVLGAVIGSGAFSSVFVARNAKTRRPYAVKVFELGEGIVARRRAALAITELKVLRMLKHPCIVELVAQFIERHNFYAILRLLRGENLAELITKRYAGAPLAETP